MRDWLRSWWNDGGLRRLGRNAGTLVLGNALQSSLGIVSLAITARALGPSEFGKLALAISYATIITQLIGFQSWHAIIRYGTAALTREDRERFVGLVKSGFTLDVGAAAIAACLAVIGVLAGRDLIGLDEQSAGVALLFAIAILANITGTPTAILRIFDRYRLFVVQSFITSLIKIVLVALAWWLDARLWTLALAWCLSQVIGNALLAWFALRELAARGMLGEHGLGVRATFREHPDLAKFFLMTNLNSTTRTLRDLDMAAVGWFLGAAAAGSFRVGRQLAGALNKVVDPFYNAVYPDLARLRAQGETEAAMRLVWRSAVSLGSIGVVVLVGFALIGETVMVLVLGESFRTSFPLALWCVAGGAVWAFAQPLAPMLMVLGRQSALFTLNIVATALYLAALIVLGRLFGPTAVGAAFAGYLLLWTASCVALLLGAVARERPAA